MKWTIAVALFATVSALQIDSPPALVTCQPASIQFSAGTAPYFVAVLPAGETAAVALEQFPETQNSPLTWNVNLEAGTNVSLRVTDSTGAVAYSSPVVVQSGPNTSCLGTSASASGSSGASASASGTASASGSGSPSSSSAAATAAPSNGVHLGKEVQGGMLAITGLFAAALGLAF